MTNHFGPIESADTGTDTIHNVYVFIDGVRHEVPVDVQNVASLIWHTDAAALAAVLRGRADAELIGESSPEMEKRVERNRRKIAAVADALEALSS